MEKQGHAESCGPGSLRHPRKGTMVLGQEPGRFPASCCLGFGFTEVDELQSLGEGLCFPSPSLRHTPNYILGFPRGRNGWLHKESIAPVPGPPFWVTLCSEGGRVQENGSQPFSIVGAVRKGSCPLQLNFPFLPSIHLLYVPFSFRLNNSHIS
jgi:hypothetical protein